MQDKRRETIDLVRWRLVQHVGPRGTGYRLVGYDLRGGSARISSPVVSIDLGAPSAVTEKGRTYRLSDVPGWGLRELGVLGHWQEIYGVADEDLRIGVSLREAAEELAPAPARSLR